MTEITFLDSGEVPALDWLDKNLIEMQSTHHVERTGGTESQALGFWLRPIATAWNGGSQ